MRSVPFRALCLAAILSAAPARAQDHDDFEDPPISYSATKPDDAVTQLNAAFAAQAEEIRGWPARRRVRWVLDRLEVPVESQLLVFSKTSLQRSLIGPDNPRALFFSDEAYVGWVPGGGIEITVFDPKLGATFYLLDAKESLPKPLFVRSQECLLCHKRHERTPGLRTRSVYPAKDGEPLSGSGSANIEPATPLGERWGGWYVTGTPGALRHRGNVTGARAEEFEGEQGLSSPLLPDLKGLVETRRYPLGTSDVIALIIHDHQVHVHNVISTANQQARVALHRWPAMRAVLGLPKDAAPAGSCLAQLSSQAERLIEALLCRDEAPFPEGGIKGDGVFEAIYAKSRKADSKGRSLRDLDLTGRLFKYRCSPLIYSKSFGWLPKEVRDLTLVRLSAGLRAANPPPAFAHLPADERKSIHEILSETLPDLPTGWGR
ncbi:MAG: hypothetical protein ACO3ND_02450 [Opitutales bacterium]